MHRILICTFLVLLLARRSLGAVVCSAGISVPAPSSISFTVDYYDLHKTFADALDGVYQEEYTIVTDAIGCDATPVYRRLGLLTTTTTTPTNFWDWFHSVSNTNIKFTSSLVFTRVGSAITGVITYYYDSNAFFPLDNNGYGNEGLQHNYVFTTALSFPATYLGAASPDLLFISDGDIWVYADDSLIVQKGGTGLASVTVNLGNLEDYGHAPIASGTNVVLSVFVAQRQLGASNRLHLETVLQTNLLCLVGPVLGGSCCEYPVTCPDASVEVIAQATTPVPLPSCSPQDGPSLIGECTRSTCNSTCYDSVCASPCQTGPSACSACLAPCFASCVEPCDEFETNSTGLLLTGGSGTPQFDPCAGRGINLGPLTPPLYCIATWNIHIGYMNSTIGSVVAYIKDFRLSFFYSNITLVITDGVIACDDTNVPNAAVVTMRNSNASVVLQWTYATDGTTLNCQKLMRNFSAPFGEFDWDQYSRVDFTSVMTFGGLLTYANRDGWGNCSNNASVLCNVNSHCGSNNFCLEAPVYLDQKCNGSYSGALTTTATATATSSTTRTPTPSNTLTSSATSTPTPTLSQTQTQTSTPSNTPTSSQTQTPSNSATPTSSVTNTPTSSQSSTPTPSGTPSQTGTSTVTPSTTPSVTPSATQSIGATPSTTPTDTPTSSFTPSATLTMTGTVTQTSQPTITPSVTHSGSQTIALTPSNTPTRIQVVTLPAFPASPATTPSALPKHAPHWPWIFLPVGLLSLIFTASVVLIIYGDRERE